MATKKAPAADSEATVRLPRPHPRQAEFIHSTAKRRVVRAGRRSGKTYGIAILAVMAFLEGKRVLYATPTSDQHERFWALVKQFLGEALAKKIYTKNENNHVIAAKTGAARIKAKTAWNADTLRGDFADVLILDEFQLMHEDTWAVVGQPMMLDSGGTTVFIYTPPSPQSASVSKARDKRHAAKLFKKAQADKSGRWATFTFTSHENPYLDKTTLAELAEDMSETAYRQEILAMDLDEIPGALWSREIIEQTRVRDVPCELVLTVVGVDPKMSEKRGTAETGIIVAGLGDNGHYYVLYDASTNAGPDEWAQVVLRMHNKHNAHKIVAEVNQGGGLVVSVIRQYDKTVRIHKVSASKSKTLRAEPIATIFEQGKAHIVGSMLELEDQMTSFVPGERYSPDRLDAMVWAITALKLGKNNIVNATSKYAWDASELRRSIYA